jgi:hypothetical protein
MLPPVAGRRYLNHLPLSFDTPLEQAQWRVP